jgi:hypothetical protein
MRRSSFRSNSPRNLPRGRIGKRSLVAVLVLTALFAGCGGGKKKPLATRSVQGSDYRFAAPTSWLLSRKSHVVSALRPGSADDLVSVSRYFLQRAPTSGQIDAAARDLARALKGSVDSQSIVTVAGRAAPRYELSYSRKGDDLGLALVFVIRGRREYQLLCRWLKPENDDTSSACVTLTMSFRLS